MSSRILVVEDEMLTRRTLESLLQAEGYTVTTAGTVAEATAEVNHREYDLILLDVILPDGDGLEACSAIRRRHRMPIIILSTRRQTEDRIAGLENGADDYVVKPFEPREVVARVKAQLRRAAQFGEEGGAIRVGRMLVDPAVRDALIDGKPAGLTEKEFLLVQLLATKAGRAVSRDFLIEQLWGEDTLTTDKNIAVYIRRVRQKIEADPDDPQILLTVRGFGYRVA